MNNVTSAQARDQFPDLVSQATYAKKRTIITRRGKKVAAIIPIEDLERLQEIEDREDIKKIEYALEHGEFEDWEVVKKELLAHHGLTEDELQSRDREEG